MKLEVRFDFFKQNETHEFIRGEKNTFTAHN